MSYAIPPLVATTAPLTDGVAHGVISAPGAGFALRIVGGHVQIYLGSPVGNYRVLLRDSSGGGTVNDSGLGFGGTFQPSTDHLAIPEPGLQLPVNAGLDMFGQGPAAGTCIVVVYYFIDRVA